MSSVEYEGGSSITGESTKSDVVLKGNSIVSADVVLGEEGAWSGRYASDNLVI